VIVDGGPALWGELRRRNLWRGHVGNFYSEVRVPLLASQSLRELMTRMIAPSRQSLLVLPPSYRKLFAVLGLKALEIDEPGHAAPQLEHFGRHGFIPVNLLVKP
jgi:hypothetical protein